MAFVIYMINRKRIEIIERFSHSVLVRYVKSGITSSVSPDVIRKYIPKEKPQKQVRQNKKNNNNNNNQLNFDL